MEEHKRDLVRTVSKNGITHHTVFGSITWRTVNTTLPAIAQSKKNLLLCKCFGHKLYFYDMPWNDRFDYRNSIRRSSRPSGHAINYMLAGTYCARCGKKDFSLNQIPSIKHLLKDWKEI